MTAVHIYGSLRTSFRSKVAMFTRFDKIVALSSSRQF